MPNEKPQFRWTDEDKEQAYHLWAYVHEKNLTRVSEETGIPGRTLTYWRREYEWDAKYASETGAIAGLALSYGWDELRLGVSKAAMALVKDASNGKLEHHERLASQKLLFAILGANKDEMDGLQSMPRHISLVDARQVHVVDTPNARAIATHALESNLAIATQEQTMSKRKR